jgi:hypothetical protein
MYQWFPPVGVPQALPGNIVHMAAMIKYFSEIIVREHIGRRISYSQSQQKALQTSQK